VASEKALRPSLYNLSTKEGKRRKIIRWVRQPVLKSNSSEGSQKSKLKGGKGKGKRPVQSEVMGVGRPKGRGGRTTHQKGRKRRCSKSLGSNLGGRI